MYWGPKYPAGDLAVGLPESVSCGHFGENDSEWDGGAGEAGKEKENQGEKSMSMEPDDGH